MESTLQVPFSFWIGFLLIIGTLLALDLGVFNRKVHVVTAGRPPAGLPPG